VRGCLTSRCFERKILCRGCTKRRVKFSSIGESDRRGKGPPGGPVARWPAEMAKGGNHRPLRSASGASGKGLGVVFTSKPTNAGGAIVAVFEDTCGSLIQIYQEL
jgi:hypothetical protein